MALVVDEGAVLPDHVPDVVLGIEEAEAAEAVLGVVWLGDVVRAVDGRDRGMRGDDLLAAPDVDAERESPEAVSARAELALVVLRPLEREHDAVR